MFSEVKRGFARVEELRRFSSQQAESSGRPQTRGEVLEDPEDAGGWPMISDEAASSNAILAILKKATPVCEILFDDNVIFYDITHRELVELFGLQPRHLRVFTQKRALTGIIPYENMVVFKFEHLKGLLFWDRIMVFDADMPSVQAFTLTLRASIRRNDLIQERLKQPFELVVLECLLDELAVYYESSFSRLYYLINLHLDKITSGQGDDVREDGLYKLLPLEHRMSSLQVRLDRAFKTLDQLLATDEDMAACYLTFRHEQGEPAPPDEHMQVELIMETYRTRMEDLLDRIAEVFRQIESTRTVFALSLDNTRNRIARMDLSLTMGAVSLSFSMAIAGFFGMNITHGYEHQPPLVFWSVMGLGVVGSIAIFHLCRKQLASMRSTQNKRMRDFRVFKSVLENLDQVHYLLRRDTDLSHRSVAQVRALTRPLAHSLSGSSRAAS